MRNVEINKGITLIALIITIIVMLILVGVTVTVAIQGSLFDTAKKSGIKTEIELIREQVLVAMTEKIADNNGEEIDDYELTIYDINISDDLKDKYRDKLIINNIGELEYDPSVIKGEERENFDELGIICIADYFTFREGYHYNSMGPETGERGIRCINSTGKEAINRGKKVFQIPSEDREGHKITAIQPYAFDSIKINKFILPDTILCINERAFWCAGGELRIPKSVIRTSYEILWGFEGNVYVPFTREEGVPSGWSSSWKGGTIIYADEI